MTHYEALGKLAAYYAERPDLMHADRAEARLGPLPSGLARLRRRVRLVRLRARRRARIAVSATALPGRATP
ncbi:hypothetical protein [Demequina activiva]|uniref:Uncharacterized protein n=1 Tax=Demequina activiva TaxID=1582364 RepID=A0A919UL52_9MICO|nr:hypothetical protein [Demequina activiva]GIG54373.1 hypothetical protein Dac01nite_11250 [Demequina activiva]